MGKWGGEANTKKEPSTKATREGNKKGDQPKKYTVSQEGLRNRGSTNRKAAVNIHGPRGSKGGKSSHQFGGDQRN